MENPNLTLILTSDACVRCVFIFNFAKGYGLIRYFAPRGFQGASGGGSEPSVSFADGTYLPRPGLCDVNLNFGK